MRNNIGRRSSSRDTPSPYTRWLALWLPCDEAAGSLVLNDRSAYGNHVSPNFAPVWRPGFTIGAAGYLKCMRPATQNNSGVLLEPTAVGGSGGITGSTEPNWNVANGSVLTENAGANSITWTTRAASIALGTVGGMYGVTCGLGGKVCYPRSPRGMMDKVFGWMKTDTWEYTANTLSCSTTAINDTANAIPAGLVAGNIVLSTGWPNVDDQMFGSVAASPAPTASSFTINGGLVSADANAGALPITLRRVYLPYSVVLCAWIVPQAGAFTNLAYLMRAATDFGSSGSAAFLRSYLRENNTRTMVNQLAGPSGGATSAISAAMTANQPTHVAVVYDLNAAIEYVYLNGVVSASAALTKNSRCVLRDVSDTTWLVDRIFQLQFFAGDPQATYRDVQLYVAPSGSLPLGLVTPTLNDLILKIKNGNGPLTKEDWP